MEYKQGVTYVNCPYCGEIVEVICPIPNVVVYQVLAKNSWLKARVVDNSNYTVTTNECACSKCKNTMYLVWFTYPKR